MSDAVLSRRLAESEAGRGMLLEEDGRYAEAFDAFRSALELEPDSLHYRYEASRLAFLAGDVRYGTRQAEALHRRYPENVLVSELFAYGCMLEGRDDESERLYRELLEKHERYGPVALNLSLLLERRGAYREAFDILRPSADEWKDETVAGFGKRKLYLRLADLASEAFMPGDELIWLTKALETKGGRMAGQGPLLRARNLQKRPKSKTMNRLSNYGLLLFLPIRGSLERPSRITRNYPMPAPLRLKLHLILHVYFSLIWNVIRKGLKSFASPLRPGSRMMLQ